MLRKIINGLAAFALTFAPVIAEAAPPTASGGAATTPAQIQAAVFPNLHPVPRIAGMGDSIGNYTMALSSNSWLFYALATRPRRVFLEPTFNLEATGPAGTYGTSGSSFAVPGSTSANAGCNAPGTISTGMTCPNKLAAVAQYNPDVLFITVGANEYVSGPNQGPVTVANIQIAVNYILANQPTPRLRAIIVTTALPRSAAAGSATLMTQANLQYAINMRRALLALEASNPLYHVFDVAAAMVDPAQAGFAPIGSCTATPGTAGAVTADCLHYSNGFAFNFGADRVTSTGAIIESAANKMLDTVLGTDTILPPMLAQGDYWDAVSAPFGQLMSTETCSGACTGSNVTANTNQGMFTISGGTNTGVGAGSPAQFPVGWGSTATGFSNNAELTWTGTIGNTITDAVGIKHNSWNVVYGSVGSVPLTADRAWSVNNLNIPSTRLVAGATYTASVHAKIKAGCTGLVAISAQVTIQDSASGHLNKSYAPGVNALPATHNWTGDLIQPGSTDLDLDIPIPAMVTPLGATFGTPVFYLTTNWLNGVAPACEIDWGDAQFHRAQ